jgi:hypothetical protein
VIRLDLRRLRTPANVTLASGGRSPRSATGQRCSCHPYRRFAPNSCARSPRPAFDARLVKPVRRFLVEMIDRLCARLTVA